MKRCTNCTITVLSCSFTGKHQLCNFGGTNTEEFRNKHIMIDLGTGNNNKMYVDPCRFVGLAN
jgi:hypothetical protein